MLPPSWQNVLAEEINKPYFLDLCSFLKKEYSLHEIYPPKQFVFNAFHKTPFDKVRVVLLGQDPYHGPSQAHGLSFSVPKGVHPPPSLQNIFKELKSDLGIPIPSHGCLEPWAEQGILLLNTILTVRSGEAASHANQGWELFTERCLALLWAEKRPIIFLLWGKIAQERGKMIFQTPNSVHKILLAPHPSPFSASRGFFGSKPFSKINEELTKLKMNPIDWRLS